MLEVYLSYNSSLLDYSLNKSKDRWDISKRENFGNLTSNEIVKKLKQTIDFKRKSLFYIVNFPEDTLKDVKVFLEKYPKIKYQILDDF